MIDFTPQALSPISKEGFRLLLSVLSLFASSPGSSPLPLSGLGSPAVVSTRAMRRRGVRLQGSPAGWGQALLELCSVHRLPRRAAPPSIVVGSIRGWNSSRQLRPRGRCLPSALFASGGSGLLLLACLPCVAPFSNTNFTRRPCRCPRRRSLGFGVLGI